MNVVAVVPQTEARMSPHHVDTHQQPRVHRTRGLGEMLRRTWLAPSLRDYPQGFGLRWHGLRKVEHHRHQGSLVHPLGLGASGVLVQFSQLEDSGACPPLGTHC
jgi:hypothetical protein